MHIRYDPLTFLLHVTVFLLPIIGVHDSVPGDGGGVNVQSEELTNLNIAQISRGPVKI